MKWITRANVKVDRVACPWLIRTFIDRDAEFLFVPVEQVETTARKTAAAAEKTMGLESLVALVASTGGFSMTCLTAATFRIDPPPANPTPLAE
jgi:hypothetical protein